MLAFGSVIGILGGGQLGRMMAMAAAELGYHVHIFTNEVDAPAEEVSKFTTVADYHDEKALKAFAESVDMVTLEFENIPLNTARIIEASQTLWPTSSVLEICQHRMREKEFIRSLDIQTAPFMLVETPEQLQQAGQHIGFPGILKTATLGYDGKGQWKLTKAADVDALGEEITFNNTYIYEGFVGFTKEISVIIARNALGETSYYPPVENIHKNHILHQTIAPADISAETKAQALDIAKKIANALELVGIVAIEMFVLKDGRIAVNELAPRPHNSGHWTLDATPINQFELTIRAITGLPLPDHHNYLPAIMTNLIGDDVMGAEKYLQQSGCCLHLYGKKEARLGRKMGHVTQLVARV